MSHGHAHAHGHAPGRDGTDYGVAFAFGIALNVAFVAIEAFYGWKIDSPAPIEGLTIMVVAAIGIVVHTATALLFMQSREPFCRCGESPGQP